MRWCCYHCYECCPATWCNANGEWVFSCSLKTTEPFLVILRLSNAPSNIGVAAKTVLPPRGKKKPSQIAHIVTRTSDKISNSKNYRMPAAGWRQGYRLIGSKWWPDWKGLNDLKEVKYLKLWQLWIRPTWLHQLFNEHPIVYSWFALTIISTCRVFS